MGSEPQAVTACGHAFTCRAERLDGWLWSEGGGWRGLSGEPPPVQGLAVVAEVLRLIIGDSGSGGGDSFACSVSGAGPQLFGPGAKN